MPNSGEERKKNTPQKSPRSNSKQPDLFETAHIKLECPYRINQKNWKPTFKPFANARKRKNKCTDLLQYVNFTNNKPLAKIKYALN